MTRGSSQANAELHFVSHLEPPGSAHQPPAAGDDWQRAGQPASLLFSSHTESDNDGTVVAALWAHMLCSGGQEVARPSCMSPRCSRQRENTETLFWWLHVTFTLKPSSRYFNPTFPSGAGRNSRWSKYNLLIRRVSNAGICVVSAGFNAPLLDFFLHL